MNKKMHASSLAALVTLWLAMCGLNRAEAVTNVVTIVSISLSGVRQSGDTATAVRMTTKDLLAALNATGQFRFGPNAVLTLRSQDDELPSFWVQEKAGTNIEATDVSAFLFLSEDLEIHADNNMNSYSFQTVNFDNRNGTAFSVWGVTSLHRTTISSHGIGPLSRVSSANAQVTGGGTIGGADAILRGTFTAGSAHAEVDP